MTTFISVITILVALVGAGFSVYYAFDAVREYRKNKKSFFLVFAIWFSLLSLYMLFQAIGLFALVF